MREEYSLQTINEMKNMIGSLRDLLYILDIEK
jgi:hypothetical protein